MTVKRALDTIKEIDMALSYLGRDSETTAATELLVEYRELLEKAVDEAKIGYVMFEDE